MGGGVLLSGCTGRLHGMRRRVGFVVVGERLLMHGQVTRRTPADFRDVMAANPQITTLVLQDMQGVRDVDAALALGRDVRARGLSTALQSDSDVSGAAVALFLAGTGRQMVEGAQLGLHNWPEGAQGYVVAVLGSDAFHQFALQVGATDRIHRLTTQEIAQYGLLTEPMKIWN